MKGQWANALTLSRLFLALSLLFLPVLSWGFIAVYLFCGLSDLLDGLIARRTGTSSDLGARLDSLADFTLAAVLIVRLLPIIDPGWAFILWAGAIALVRFASAGLNRRKYRTWAFLHTWANKVTGLALFLYPLTLALAPGRGLLAGLCLLASLSAFEELLIVLTSRELDLNRRSIFHRPG